VDVPFLFLWKGRKSTRQHSKITTEVELQRGFEGRVSLSGFRVSFTAKKERRGRIYAELLREGVTMDYKSE